jgi:hypothetical protein
MMIIGVDYHPSFQAIESFDSSFIRHYADKSEYSAIRLSDEMSQFLNKARFREENVFAVVSFRAERSP